MTEPRTLTAENIHLSNAQAGMLLFFHGTLKMPCATTRTITALAARGLLARDDRTLRYCLTELGHAVIERLDPDATYGPYAFTADEQ